MIKTGAILLAVAGLCSTLQETTSPVLRTYHEVLPAAAAIEFCEEFPTECIASPVTYMPVNSVRFAELKTVNDTVNAQMRYGSDQELFGVDEKWTLNETADDCEGFAFVKRKRLIALGWPASTLLVTVVRTPEKTMHAILIAHTASGDFLLDKTTHGSDRIRRWYEMPYEYIAQQSKEDPHRWVSLTKRDPDFQTTRWITSK